MRNQMLFTDEFFRLEKLHVRNITVIRAKLSVDLVDRGAC
jgi:hypothetical protein